MRCVCSALLLIHCAVSASSSSNTVDIFNATSGSWSTAALSVARCWLAAASLPESGLAIIAGGYGALFVLISVIAGRGCGRIGWVSGMSCACASAFL